MKKLLILMLIIISVSCHGYYQDTEAEYYTKLDQILEKKKGELIQYMDMIEKTISSIDNDGPLIESFELLNLAYNAYKVKNKAPVIKLSLNEIESIVQRSYLERFMIFDNVLFINKGGDVFYSLKKKAPLLENIFDSKYEGSKLSKSLKSTPLASAVDFGFFSKEDPSAFFVYPVFKQKEHLGWCAFQFTSSKLETLFSTEKGLGGTGEAFMVNEDSYLLTDSFFSPESSVLKLHLSGDNISSKFVEGQGHKKIIDYRGYEAITSFEVISLYNLNWLLIAKMDLDEVITQDFINSKNEYYSRVKQKSMNIEKNYITGIVFDDYANEVSLDQFKRISDGGSLYTHGVSTCTAVVITLQDKFTYLAHISAYDSIYGGQSTDLIGNMFDRIRKYEIPDYLFRELKIYIITPEIQFTENVVEKLVGEGLFLSQISLVQNKNAAYVNVYHNLDIGKTYVEWKVNSGGLSIEDLDQINDIGWLISKDENSSDSLGVF